MSVVVSPHYYYPQDHKWQFEGTLERVMHGIGMFDRKDSLDLKGFVGSGADWMPQYKKYIEDGKTIVCSPHKVHGPEQNDLVLQLRKIGIDKVILAGMSATSVSKAICANCWKPALRSHWCAMPRPAPRYPRAMAISLR